MKLHNKLCGAGLCLATVFFAGCNDEQDAVVNEVVISEQQQGEALLSKQEQDLLKVMRDSYAAIGEIALLPNVREEIVTEIEKEYDGNTDARLRILFNGEDNTVNGRARTTSFSEQFAKSVDDSDINGRGDLSASLKEKMIKNNLILYVPYFEYFDWKSIKEVTVTYHPLVQEDYNEGLVYFASSKQPQKVKRVDDAYCEKNPTIILKPAEGNDEEIASFQELKKLRLEKFAQTEAPSENSRVISSNFLSSVTSSKDISETDVLATYVPYYRMMQPYKGIFGGQEEIQIYRASAPMKFKSDGTFEIAEKDLILRDNVKRSDARGTWQGGFTFDADWDMHEAEQAIMVIAKKARENKFVFEGKVGVGYDVDTKKFVPEVKATADFKFDVGSDWRRIYNTPSYSRSGALTTFVGDNGLGIIKLDGVNYGIQSFGTVQYLMKFRWTDISE